jgi:hypothetical protein
MPPAAARRRSGPSWAVVAVVVLLAAAIAVAVAVAMHRSTSDSSTSFRPGQPRLHPAKVEKDMRRLEQLVHR